MGHWRSVAVQTVSEPEICQGAGFNLRAGARVRIQDVKRIYMASRARNDDKRSKEKREFGPILNIRFLLGWRLRHQAKIVTSFLLMPAVRGSYSFFLVTVLVALTVFQPLFFFFITKVSPNDDFEPLCDVTVIIIRE